MMDMIPYSCMTNSELEQQYAAVLEVYDRLKAQGLKLNMARGKPAKAQLDLVSDLLTALTTIEDCFDGDNKNIKDKGLLYLGVLCFDNSRK